MKPLARALAFAIAALAGATGCASISGPTARYARAEDQAAVGMVPLAELPHRLCVRRAQYAFLAELVKAAAPTSATGDPWPSWYAEAPSHKELGRPVTWKRDCIAEGDTAVEVRAVLRGLREHARALASLASGSTAFDASGIESAASGAGDIATKLGAGAGTGASMTQAGAAFASFSGLFVKLYRKGKLDDAVAASDACIRTVMDDLHAMIKVLSDELGLAEVDRDLVIGVLHRDRARVPSSPGFVMASAFEVTADVGAEYARIRQSLVRYDAAITELQTAHHALAQLAVHQVSSNDVGCILDQLNHVVDSMIDEEWNR
jgi:hypothetical protein